MLTATQALQRLREGNQRFAPEDPAQVRAQRSAQRRRDVAEKQEPVAIILGCADARVPLDVIFDQDLGDLFVIRVAGNIVAPSLIGSIEFAARKFATRLIVVLGHSRCGAVETTLKELQSPQNDSSENLGTIVNFIRPSIAPLLESDLVSDRDAMVKVAIRANVIASTRRMREDSEILATLERDDGLVIVGAEYDLDTGIVDFFEGVPIE